MAEYLPSQSSQAFDPATVRRAVVGLAKQRLKKGGKGKILKSNEQGKIELGLIFTYHRPLAESSNRSSNYTPRVELCKLTSSLKTF